MASCQILSLQKYCINRTSPYKTIEDIVVKEQLISDLTLSYIYKVDSL